MKTTMLMILAALSVMGSAFAQPPAAPKVNGPALGKTQSQSWRIGATIAAKDVACKNVTASAPFPMDWPEQSVKIIEEDVPASAKLSYKSVKGGGAKQLVAAVSLLPAGQQRKIVVTVEVTRREIVPPQDTSIFLVPDVKRLTSEARACLQPSHDIESDDPRIQSLAREVTDGKRGAWQKVEAIYDWTRNNIKDRSPAGKGALKAIENGYGDGVEISSVFVALCRAAGVPARLVWLPRHCYPEFMLEDGKGNRTWFPCRAAGKREFGGLAEYRPILSKGDQFPVAGKPQETERFVAEEVTGFGGQPTVQFIREPVK